MTVLKNIDTVILHSPKTGGSSVRWPAINLYGVRYSCQHCDFKMLPEAFKDFRKVTFIRRPKSWYASRYFFDFNKMKQNAVKREPFSDALSLNYTLDFKSTLKNMLNLTEAFKNKTILEEFKNRVRFEVLNNYQCWWVSYFDDLEKITPEYFENKTLYQWFNEIVGVYECDSIYRLEDQYEFGMKKEFGEMVNLVHRNKTKRPKDEAIYDEEMLEWVFEKENKFIRKFYA